MFFVYILLKFSFIILFKKKTFTNKQNVTSDIFEFIKLTSEIRQKPFLKRATCLDTVNKFETQLLAHVEVYTQVETQVLVGTDTDTNTATKRIAYMQVQKEVEILI